LEELKENHKIIGEVRGQGLMVGVELVRNQETEEPATQEILTIMEVSREKGLLIGKGGLDNNVIRIQPPLALTKEQTDDACSILDEAFTKAEKDL
jgi:4-aminobutyrate aminotransferase-like enzyme